MLISSAELLRPAVQGGFAVGGFDTSCYQLTEAILRAAEETQTPLLVMANKAAFGRPYDDAFLRYLAQRCAEIQTPVALHLDHCDSVERICRAMDVGFTSVMIDASALPFAQNVAKTREVVRLAHERGVSVEAEIGGMGGEEASLQSGSADESRYTRPEDALAFWQATGVDLLAVAFGTVHGPYKGTPKLDFERLSKIRALLPQVPLVMHGGSGLSDDDFRAAIRAGINKINVFTEISVLYASRLAEAVQSAGGKLHLHQALAPAEDAATQAVEQLIRVFGTPGKEAFL